MGGSVGPLIFIEVFATDTFGGSMSQYSSFSACVITPGAGGTGAAFEQTRSITDRTSAGLVNVSFAKVFAAPNGYVPFIAEYVPDRTAGMPFGSSPAWSLP